MQKAIVQIHLANEMGGGHMKRVVTETDTVGTVLQYMCKRRNVQKAAHALYLLDSKMELSRKMHDSEQLLLVLHQLAGQGQLDYFKFILQPVPTISSGDPNRIRYNSLTGYQQEESHSSDERDSRSGSRSRSSSKPSPAPKIPYVQGDAIDVWSVAASQWYTDGVVQKVDRMYGRIHVTYANDCWFKGNKWIEAKDVPTLLRRPFQEEYEVIQDVEYYKSKSYSDVEPQMGGVTAGTVITVAHVEDVWVRLHNGFWLPTVRGQNILLRKTEPLPDGWRCVVESFTGKRYYQHEITKEVRFDPPTLHRRVEMKRGTSDVVIVEGIHPHILLNGEVRESTLRLWRRKIFNHFGGKDIMWTLPSDDKAPTSVAVALSAAVKVSEVDLMTNGLRKLMRGIRDDVSTPVTRAATRAYDWTSERVTVKISERDQNSAAEQRVQLPERRYRSGDTVEIFLQGHWLPAEVIKLKEAEEEWYYIKVMDSDYASEQDLVGTMHAVTPNNMRSTDTEQPAPRYSPSPNSRMFLATAIGSVPSGSVLSDASSGSMASSGYQINMRDYDTNDISGFGAASPPNLPDGYLQSSPTLSHSSPVSTTLGIPPSIHLGPPRRTTSDLSINARAKEHLDFNHLTISDLVEISHRLQEGLDIRDRQQNFQVFRRCFIGREAVDYMVKHNMVSSRSDAAMLGQELHKAGFFSHVLREHPFKDQRIFYRFINDQEAPTKSKDPNQQRPRLSRSRSDPRSSSPRRSSRPQGHGPSHWGPLMLSPDRGHTWQRKYFVLDGRGAKLFYFMNRKKFQARQPENKIDLLAGNAVVRRVTRGQYLRQLCFEILTPDKNFMFKASTYKDLTTWIRQIRRFNRENHELDALDDFMEATVEEQAFSDDSIIDKYSTFGAVLEDRGATNSLIKFLASFGNEAQLADRLLQFLIDVQKFTEIGAAATTAEDAADVHRFAAEIFNSYIGSKAQQTWPGDIITNEERLDLLRLIKTNQSNAKMYDWLQKRVFDQLDNNVFPSFLQSSYFLNLVTSKCPKLKWPSDNQLT